MSETIMVIGLIGAVVSLPIMLVGLMLRKSVIIRVAGLFVLAASMALMSIGSVASDIGNGGISLYIIGAPLAAYYAYTTAKLALKVLRNRNNKDNPDS